MVGLGILSSRQMGSRARGTTSREWAPGPANPYSAIIGANVSPGHVGKGVAFMATGKVKWFNDQKGYGFISSVNDGKDVFVHHSVIEGDGFKTLQENETVEYDAEASAKGLKATKVRRLVAAS